MIIHQESASHGPFIGDLFFHPIGSPINEMPRQYLLSKFHFIGDPSEDAWLGSVTLPESYFSIMGVGPFFTDSGVPINVPQVIVEDWIAANGQQPHWWIYRHWLYVYDPYLITEATANKCARVTKYNRKFYGFLTFNNENITFNACPLEVNYA